MFPRAKIGVSELRRLRLLVDVGKKRVCGDHAMHRVEGGYATKALVF